MKHNNLEAKLDAHPELGNFIKSVQENCAGSRFNPEFFPHLLSFPLLFVYLPFPFALDPRVWYGTFMEEFPVTKGFNLKKAQKNFAKKGLVVKHPDVVDRYVALVKKGLCDYDKTKFSSDLNIYIFNPKQYEAFLNNEQSEKSNSSVDKIFNITLYISPGTNVWENDECKWVRNLKSLHVCSYDLKEEKKYGLDAFGLLNPPENHAFYIKVDDKLVDELDNLPEPESEPKHLVLQLDGK